MLDRSVVSNFLKDELEGIKIPEEIKWKELVETFCRYIEDDYYEWIKDNFKSFFNHGNPDWKWVKEKVEGM